MKGATFPVSLSTDGAVSEPDVRMGQPPSNLKGEVTVTGLTAGSSYILYRFLGTDALPKGPDFSAGFQYKTPFTAAGPSWTHADPHTFLSSSAVYYVCVSA